MAQYYNLSVFKDVYKLVWQVLEYNKDFQTEYKHTFGLDKKKDNIQFVGSTYRANCNSVKNQYLEEFLNNFEKLKIEVSSHTDFKYIISKNLEVLSKILDITDKQVTAWQIGIIKTQLSKIPFARVSKVLLTKGSHVTGVGCGIICHANRQKPQNSVANTKNWSSLENYETNAFNFNNDNRNNTNKTNNYSVHAVRDSSEKTILSKILHNKITNHVL
jgi:hypothetical protein